MVTKFHLNICTVEVVDTGHHLTHPCFPSKVVLIIVSQVQTNPRNISTTKVQCIHHGYNVVTWVQCCYFKFWSFFLVYFHRQKGHLFFVSESYIITLLPNKLHCMINVTIHFSAGLSPPFGMLHVHPGGYQYPPPQHLYSGVGGHQPSSTPPQLQQGND